MTQEELDALMNGDVDIDALEDGEDEEIAETAEEQPADEEDSSSYDTDGHTVEDYRVSATNNWPPPPPSDDNKVVNQLDDVTKESEAKATEIFDIIEGISNELMEKEGHAQTCVDTFESNIALFEKLTAKFPDVASFSEQLDLNRSALEQSQELHEMLQNSGDQIMNVMDIMQYQDIHRQKIERVINVMRALSSYMNMLFEGRIDDDKRVTSAVHLPGDSTTHEVVSSDDIEELLKSFGA
jgi:chemotaxis regulatin CheY-phosphate phosphatase CheZ